MKNTKALFEALSIAVSLGWIAGWFNDPFELSWVVIASLGLGIFGIIQFWRYSSSGYWNTLVGAASVLLIVFALGIQFHW